MKLLILFFIFSANISHGQEMASPSEGKELVGMYKGYQVGESIQGSSEFRDCAAKNKYDPKASEDQKTKSAEAAVKCFQEKLEGKDPKQINELATNLQLENYGLIQSKNVKEIQKYLGNRLYEKLTGVNLEEKDLEKKIEAMKFKNKQEKMIDQKIFFDLYRTQLGKNALYEISRFCFENLRIKAVNDSSMKDVNLVTYWKDNLPLVSETLLTDLPQFKFGEFTTSSDKSAIYKEIFKSIQGDDNTKSNEEFLSKFYVQCGKMIAPLCQLYQDKRNKTSKDIQIGANACITKDRIQNIRKAIADTQKVTDDVAKMNDASPLGLDKNQKVQIFKAEGENSLDNLTNTSSVSMLEGGANNDEELNRKMKECEDNPALKNCENFITVGDDLDKAGHAITMEMELKKEMELQRVRKLKDLGEKDLKAYLEENGYFDLAKMGSSELTDQVLKKAITTNFDTKRDAVLATMKEKLGNRQIKDDSNIATAAEKTITETKEERSRLAQVVLFNNIITSHLELSRRDAKGATSSAGRNVKAWEKEQKDLEGSDIDPKLFANIKTSPGDDKNSMKDNEFMDFEILDQFLGKSDDKTTPTPKSN